MPIPSKKEHKIRLISKVGTFIRRMRWKALAFLGKTENDRKQTYDFLTQKCPPNVEYLTNLE